MGVTQSHLEWNALPAKSRLDIGNAFGEFRVLAIHLVDHEHPGNVRPVAHVPGAFCSHFHTGGGGNHDYSTFNYPEGAYHLAKEVVVTRRIQKINLGIVLGNRHQSCLDTATPFDLFRFEVRHSVAVGDTS